MGKLNRIVKKLFPKTYQHVRAEWFAYHPDLTQQMYSCSWSLGEDIEKNCNIFVDDEKRNDVEYMARLKRDIVRCYYLYGTNTNEYFMHNMEHKSRTERETILSKRLKDDYCLHAMRGGAPFAQLKDKWAFYQLAGQFFNREVILVDEKTNQDMLRQFLSNHPRFFAKPLEGTWGVGCFSGFYDAKSGGGALPYQFASGRWIVEDLIEQDDRMAKWNESSINTMRMPSFRDANGNIEIMFPLIRIGRKGCVVDNAGSGGVFASVDEKTGVVCTDGYDEDGHIFIEHPDSHVVFKGYQIPHWKELLKLVKEIHKCMPVEHKYIGFDMALSKKGWVLVEGNWGEFVMQQRALGRGIRKDFETLLKNS